MTVELTITQHSAPTAEEQANLWPLTSYKPHPFWYLPSGNIILFSTVNPGCIFKVHREMIHLNPYLVDIPRVLYINDEGIEIRGIDQSVDYLARLLKEVYDPGEHFVRPYGDLSNGCIPFVASMWPSALEEWDEMQPQVAVLGDLEQYSIADTQLPNAALALCFAIERNIPCMYASTLATLIRDCCTPEKELITSSLHGKTDVPWIISQGRKRMQAEHVHVHHLLILHATTPAPSCMNTGRCAPEWQALCSMASAMIAALDPHDGLFIWRVIAQPMQLVLCPHCTDRLEKLNMLAERRRYHLWAWLSHVLDARHIAPPTEEKVATQLEMNL